MKPARLFALATAGFSVAGLLAGFAKPSRSLDLYIHDSYFIVANSHVALAAAVTCGIFALVYFACERFLRIPLSRGPSLTHFLLVVLPLGLLVVAMYSLHASPEVGFNTTLVKVLTVSVLAGAMCFLAGCCLFVFNFGWGVILFLRRREKSNMGGNA
jgi:cytochrome c oxidase subunit I